MGYPQDFDRNILAFFGIIRDRDLPDNNILYYQKTLNKCEQCPSQGGLGNSPNNAKRLPISL
jgi:hypothetical protein